MQLHVNDYRHPALMFGASRYAKLTYQRRVSEPIKENSSKMDPDLFPLFFLESGSTACKEWIPPASEPHAYMQQLGKQLTSETLVGWIQARS